MPSVSREKTALLKLVVCTSCALLLFVLLPAWMWSTVLAAPLAQGTLPPRYSPTPEPTTVEPTTVVPTTVVPTTAAPTTEPTGGGETTAAPALTATPAILLPSTGAKARSVEFPALTGAMLTGGVLALLMGWRLRKRSGRE